MLNKGVKGYVLKDSDETILLDAIAAVYKGQSYMDPSLRDRASQDMVKTRKGAQAPTVAYQTRKGNPAADRQRIHQPGNR